ncbi:hypothetical protein D1Y75_06035 [Riemerella anatipestifer]|nr:hypothetical protein [Riemerella anatipestifer]OBP63538.1 hypothetical protein AWB84_05090 [Riemerella anatipestifer]
MFHNQSNIDEVCRGFCYVWQIKSQESYHISLLSYHIRVLSYHIVKVNKKGLNFWENSFFRQKSAIRRQNGETKKRNSL